MVDASAPIAQDQLGRAAVFAAVVRHGSFSEAARRMGLARSTCCEHVATLERAVGARLLERTTRRVALTEEGEIIFSRIDDALRAWGEAFSALEARGAEPIGVLRIATGVGLVEPLVAPVCGELVAAHPRLEVELLVDDRVHDLIADRIDVAVRMAPLSDSELVCRKLGTTQTILAASPSFAATLPEASVDAFKAMGWVGHGAVPSSTVNLHDPSGTVHTIRPRYRGKASGSLAENALIEQGCGIALVPELLARPSIAAGRLERVYPEWHGREIPFYAVYTASSFTRPRVSHFLEGLVRRVETAW
ncbi:MAG: LysR family transcriptional regulator [Myxococcota bacterium]